MPFVPMVNGAITRGFERLASVLRTGGFLTAAFTLTVTRRYDSCIAPNGRLGPTTAQHPQLQRYTAG